MASHVPARARPLRQERYTDEPTLKEHRRIMPAAGPMCTFDPWRRPAKAWRLPKPPTPSARGRSRPFAAEYAERAATARQLVDRCIHDLDGHADLAPVLGLLWLLNPPVWRPGGETPTANIAIRGCGRAQVEKFSYQCTLPLLQYGGVLIFIIVPSYVPTPVGRMADAPLSADLSIYRAVETQFKQVVIFGRRIRQAARPGVGSSRPCVVCCVDREGRCRRPRAAAGMARLPPVPTSPSLEPEHFYRVTMNLNSSLDEVGPAAAGSGRRSILFWAPRKAVAASARAGLVALAFRPWPYAAGAISAW